jgi:hypothetical protein
MPRAVYLCRRSLISTIRTSPHIFETKAAEEAAPAAEPAPAEKPIDTLRRIMAEANVTDADIQKVVASKGHYAADTPVDSYQEKFISGWLIKYWPQILNLVSMRTARSWTNKGGFLSWLNT